MIRAGLRDPGKLLDHSFHLRSVACRSRPLQGSTSLHLSAPSACRSEGDLAVFLHLSPYIMKHTRPPGLRQPSYLHIPGVKIPSLKLIMAAPHLLDASRKISDILEFLCDEADLDCKLEEAHVDGIRDDIRQFENILDRLYA